MNRESVRLVLTEELGLRKICTNIVPRGMRGLAHFLDIQMHYDDAAASLPHLSTCDFFFTQSKIGSERIPV